MLAARRRTVRVIDKDVVVAGRADQAVDRFAELIVAGVRRMFVACVIAAHGHWIMPLPFMASIAVS